jgi:Ca-activated chloride channel family protein
VIVTACRNTNEMETPTMIRLRSIELFPARALLASMLAAAACGSDDGASGDGFGGSGGANVGHNGAQDFGQFRSILEAGDIPGPDTLDDVGFFAEHHVELPAPTCGQDICLHGQVGVMGNMITGSNCTTLLVGMNTPIDPASYERPPLNLAVAVDTSGSMQGESIAYVREGLLRMLDALDPADTVTIVTFDDDAKIRAEALAGDDPLLAEAIGQLGANGYTNIYDGLRTAYESVARHAAPDKQNRVILLSDGEATSGITSSAQLVEMSAAYNAAGYGLTTIGMGEEFDATLMRELAESGAGAFYFLESPGAVQEVFEEEVQTFLVPLAENLRIEVDIDAKYSLRAIYGTKLFTITGGRGVIDIPTVQIAHRTSAADDMAGRRGGGGAIAAELVPTSGEGASAGAVGTLTLTFELPGSDEPISQQVAISSPVASDAAADYFDAPAVEKTFVMLNVFAGFQMAATRASYGDDRGALGVLEPLRDAVATWLEGQDDDDIESDLHYIDLFIANLEARGAAAPPPSKNPPEPWPQD